MLFCVNAIGKLGGWSRSKPSKAAAKVPIKPIEKEHAATIEIANGLEPLFLSPASFTLNHCEVLCQSVMMVG